MRPRLLPLAAVLLLAACDNAPKPDAATTPAPLAVETAPFSAVRIFPERDAPAAVVGKNETRLAAEVAARIVELPVDSGDRVARGQVVARLDDRDAALALARADAALAQAQARLDHAQAQARRARDLKEKNFYSAEALGVRETELAAAAADRKAAQAARDTAAHALAKTTLRAPFPAVVRARTAQLGEITAPGTPLLTLADLGELQVLAQVQARDAAGLERADNVEFEVGAQRHALKRLRVSSAVSRDGRTVEARFALAGATLAPGSEGRLVWRDAVAHLPAELLVRRGAEHGVFIVEAAQARFVAVSGAQEGRPAAVALPDDAQVVRHGRHALRDGAAVAVAAARK